VELAALASGARIPAVAPNGAVDRDQGIGLRFKRPFGRGSAPRIPPLLSGGIADLGQLGVLGSKVAFERGVAAPSAPNVCSWLLSELPGTADEDTPRMIIGIIQLDDQLFGRMNK